MAYQANASQYELEHRQKIFIKDFFLVILWTSIRFSLNPLPYCHLFILLAVREMKRKL